MLHEVLVYVRRQSVDFWQIFSAQLSLSGWTLGAKAEKQCTILCFLQKVSVFGLLSASCKQNAFCLLHGRTVLTTEALQEKPRELTLGKNRHSFINLTESEIVLSFPFLLSISKFWLRPLYNLLESPNICPSPQPLALDNCWQDLTYPSAARFCRFIGG